MTNTLFNIDLFNLLHLWTFSTKHSENIPLFFIKITQRFHYQNLNFKLKNQSSTPQMISVGFKVFKKFPSGHEAITSCWRHYDPNIKWRRYQWSLLAEACHFYCQAVKNMFADDKLFVHYIQSCVAGQQHVYLLQKV